MADNQGTEAIPRAVDRDGLTRQVVIVDVGGLAGPEELWEGAGGAGGGGTEYTEDAVASGNPVGGVPLFVRTDTPAAITDADGDNVAVRGTNFGAQYVTLLDTGGTPVAVGGGTQYTEDAAAAANPIGNATIVVRQDTPAGLTSADGDNVAVRGTNFGAQYVTLLDTGGTPVAVGGGTQYTEDAAAAADPIGNAQILIRNDVLSGQTSADGDNVAARGTDKGEMYVKHVDAIPVTDNGSSLTVDGSVAVSSVGGTVAVTQSGVWDEVGIHDSGNSITVDNAALSVVGGGVEATALRVTLANDSTGLVSVDDNGASLTVDNPVLSVVGGGAEATAQRVTLASDSTGVLSVDDNGSTLSVDDGAGSLTVDNPVLSVVGGGAEATAQRVTIANDSTGVLSVDDNGASLTVDGTVAVSNITAYTEDVATPADPVGQTALLRRDDTRTASVTANGDWIAAHATGSGSLWVAGDPDFPFSVAGQVEGFEATDAPLAGGLLGISVRASTAAPGDVSADGDQVQIWGTRKGAVNIADAGGSITVDGGVTVSGSVAEGTAASGSPVLIGGRVETTVPTAQDDGDVSHIWLTLEGGQVATVQARQVRVTATPTIATSGYVDNDQIGGEMTFAAALATGRGGMVVGASVITETVTALNGLELWLFESDPTAASADSGAWDLTDANLITARPFAVIDFDAADYRNTVSGAWCKGEEHGGPVSAPFVTSGSANIFGHLVAKGTPAAQYGGTDDLIVALWVQQF